MRRRFVLVAITLSSLTTGCPYLRDPVAPIPTIERKASGENKRGLAILLPGMFDAPEAFEKQGVLEDLRRTAPGFDAVMVDAHIGYYRGKENSIVERLRDDIVLPARREGYRDIWMVGVSLGGFGSLIYASQYPDHVSGMIVVAPFLGSDEITDEIAAAGGLAPWQPSSGDHLSGKERFFHDLWVWLDGYAADEQRPPLFLGYGQKDDFAPKNALLADALPDDQVLVDGSGGHDWATWKPLFAELSRRAFESTR